jgi:hypothetical protein
MMISSRNWWHSGKGILSASCRHCMPVALDCMRAHLAILLQTSILLLGAWCQGDQPGMRTRDVLFVLRFETWEGAAWALSQPHTALLRLHAFWAELTVQEALSGCPVSIW